MSTAEPITAPTKVPAFQHANSTSPVHQKAARLSVTAVCAFAIAVVSSITRCAVGNRRQPETSSTGASVTP